MSKRVTIPGTDLSVFPLNLGTNTFGWTSDEATAHQVLDAFVAAGGNFIDTAESYPAWVPGNTGHESEEIIGTWLAAQDSEVRENIVLATKVGDHPEHSTMAPDYVRGAIDKSLQRLQTDYVDLYYAHRDDNVTPIADQARVFDELVKTGKVRHVGVSNYSPERMREWFQVAKDEGLVAPVAIQTQYNLVFRAEFENDYRAIAEENNAAVFPYFGLAAGFLTGKYRSKEDLAGTDREGMVGGYFNDEGLKVVERLVAIAEARNVAPATVALAWQFSQGVTAPIASARNVDQLPALLDATTLELTRDEIDALNTASQTFA